MTAMRHAIRVGWSWVLASCLFASSGVCFADKVPVRPPRTYHLKNVEWHLTIHPTEGTIDGDVINSLTLLRAESEVTFDCGPLNIASVTVNGAATKSDLKGETLTVLLPDKGAHQDYKVEIRYSGKPTGGVYFIDGSASYPAKTPFVYSLGTPEDNRYWLPTYDFPNDKATSEGFITVPKGWKALSNGKFVGEKTVGDQTTIHWKMDQPHVTYLISFVAGKYEVGEEKWGNMPVQYWVPEGLLDWGKTTFGGTNKIIDFYSKQLGLKYPYDKFAQSTVPQFVFGGVENITAVTQTMNALYPPDEAGFQSSTVLIAHELAHQWFGDLITCSNWTHTWLNESFATFMPSFYLRSTLGEEAYQKDRRQTSARAEAMRNEGPVATNDFDYPGSIYRGQVYHGGAARIFMLMDKLGEDAFWKGVNAFLETYKFQPVTTEQFFASMSKSTGRDLTPFMNQWIFGTGIPHISVKTEGSELVFTVDKPGFEINPQAWIWDAARQDWLKKPLHFSASASEVRVEIDPSLANAPVMIDPDGHFLLDQTSKAPIPADQVAVIYDKLPPFAKSGNLGWLALNQSAVVKVIAEQANQTYTDVLIKLLDASSVDILVKFAEDARPQIRSAAIARLGAVLGGNLTEGAKTVLRKVATSDVYPLVRESAYKALMEGENDDSMAQKAWTMDCFGDRYRIDALTWWSYRNKDLTRKLCFEALDKPLSEPVQSAAIKILGRIGDAKGDRTAFNHLAKVIEGREIMLRQDAISAFIDYGDKAAIPLLESLKDVKMYFARGAAAGAIAELKNKPSN
jgi:aminopeptidase N